MKTLKSKFAIILGLVVLMNLGVGYFVMRENGRVNDVLRSSPTKLIDSIQVATDLNELSGTIQYLDEVLTQSVRNYAFTGDVVWRDRYNTEAPILEAAIKDAILLGDKNDKKLFDDISNANIELVRMEAQAIQFVVDNDNYSAQGVLDSAEYSKQKTIYSSGLDSFHKSKKVGADSAASSSLSELKSINKSVVASNTTNGLYIGMLISIVAAVSIIIYILIYSMILRPILVIKNATKEMTKGHLDQQIAIKSKNEIGDLAASFNIMATKLKDSVQGIEAKIASRTDELQKLNHFMTGRELKMIELKKKLNELESKNEVKK